MSEQQSPKTEGCSSSRRNFLTGAIATVAGVSVAPGISLISLAQARPLEEAVSKGTRWGMLIDTSKCADGCTDCVTACETENGWGSGSTDEQHSADTQRAQWIRKVELRDKRTGYTHTLPMLCQHCEHPPCVDVCPTGASFRRADGIVLVDKHICIGCRYCMMACPYKARSFIHEVLEDQKADVPRGKGTVESCTFCVHRTDAGRIPACVEACAVGDHHAMLFGDLNDPRSELSQRLAKEPSTQVRADLGLNVGVRYQGI